MTPEPIRQEPEKCEKCNIISCTLTHQNDDGTGPMLCKQCKRKVNSE